MEVILTKRIVQMLENVVIVIVDSDEPQGVSLGYLRGGNFAQGCILVDCGHWGLNPGPFGWESNILTSTRRSCSAHLDFIKRQFH